MHVLVRLRLGIRVGSKSDLSDRCEVTEEEGDVLIETSAKDSVNVEEMVIILASSMKNRRIALARQIRINGTPHGSVCIASMDYLSVDVFPSPVSSVDTGNFF